VTSGESRRTTGNGSRASISWERTRKRPGKGKKPPCLLGVLVEGFFVPAMVHDSGSTEGMGCRAKWAWTAAVT